MGGCRLKKLAYIHSFTDRHGRARYYFRRNGKQTPIEGAFGSAEFMDAYQALLKQEPAKPEKRKRPETGTFAALSERYFGSTKFKTLSAGSQTNYRRVINRFLREHGERKVCQLRRMNVDAMVGRFSDSPGAGIIFLKRLRTLCRYAIEIGWTDLDPTAGARSYRSVEIHTWTEGEIETFEQKWPSGTRERLAFSLLLYTGQRGSDAFRMGWPDIAGDMIRVQQQKTGAKLAIPLHPKLRAELALAKKDHVTILTTAYEQPFSVKGFGQMMSAAIQEAKLPTKCKAHGLRKAAARRLAEAGCTEKQIGAITGHKTMAEVERYTRDANQLTLARQALAKQVENEALANPAKKVSHTTGKE